MCVLRCVRVLSSGGTGYRVNPWGDGRLNKFKLVDSQRLIDD